MTFLKRLWRDTSNREIVSLFIASRLLIALLGMMSTLVIIKNKWFFGAHKAFNPLSLFANWDTSWYMSIVQHGYHFVQGKQSNAAFFPLYPLLVKIFSFYTNNTTIILITGFALSNIFCLLACFYLYKLVKIDYSESIAFKSVLFLLIYPVSFFFSIFYTEGLFLFLIVATFYYARQKNWPMVALFGFFLPLARSIGIFVLIPLVIEYLDLNSNDLELTKRFFINNFQKIKVDILYLLSLPAGAVAYMSYMYLKFGNPLIYLQAQIPWGTKFSSIITTWNNYHQNPSPAFYGSIYKAIIILVLMIVIYLISQKTRLSYVVYLLVFLFFYLSSNALLSIPRLVSVLFPLFIGLAIFSEQSRLREYAIIIASVMLLTLMTILFVNGYWLI